MEQNERSPRKGRALTHKEGVWDGTGQRDGKTVGRDAIRSRRPVVSLPVVLNTMAPSHTLDHGTPCSLHSEALKSDYLVPNVAWMLKPKAHIFICALRPPPHLCERSRVYVQ